MKRVLIVSTQSQAPSHSDRKLVIEHLADALREKNIEVKTMLFEELIFEIKKNELSIENIVDGTNLDSYDLVYIKNWRACKDPAMALYRYMQLKNTRVITSELEHGSPTSKLSEGFMLAAEKIPYPDTIVGTNSTALYEYLSQNEVSYPAVLKSVDGSAGSDNYLVSSLSEVDSIIRSNPTVTFMLQPFIPNDGDHRIITLGYEPQLAFFRSAVKGSHLNNTSQGGTATKTDLVHYSKDVLEQCRLASRILRREIAGVDVLYNKDNSDYYILEVNASPQLSSGAFIEEKKRVFVKYVESVLASEGNA